MALPLFKEKRLSVRKKLTGLLPGRLRLPDGTEFICTPKDVSQHGIGVISSQQCQQGAEIMLELSEKSVPLYIAWALPGFGKRDEFRYGLVCEDPDVDLENLFVEKGCLK